MKNIQELTTADICNVYIGKYPGCCCGCKGKHYTNSVNLEEANKSHGYDRSDTVNDKMVNKVLRTIQANEELLEVDTSYVCVILDKKKIFIAYLVAGVQCTAPVKVVAEEVSVASSAG